jgi:predicted nucleotidyltransferase
MTLRETRTKGHLSIKQASEITMLPQRTYCRYESDPAKENTIKYRYAVDRLAEYLRVDEDKGLLSIESITEKVTSVLKDRQVDFCILFGSYAKGKATEKSDVDLVVSTDITGLDFFELVEELRENLKKKIDLLRVSDLTENEELLTDVLKDGIRIYSQS